MRYTQAAVDASNRDQVKTMLRIRTTRMGLWGRRCQECTRSLIPRAATAGSCSAENARRCVGIPEPKAAEERIRVVAEAATGRELVELFSVAAAEYDVVGLERNRERGDDFVHVSTPALLAATLERGFTDVLLEGRFPKRQMRELHRLHDSGADERRAETRAESEEEHRPALVASERLHRGVVDDPRRRLERALEVEADPSIPEVDGVDDNAAAVHRCGDPDRDAIPGPPHSEALDRRDHCRGG